MTTTVSRAEQAMFYASVLWITRLQDGITLSTMEVEYVALLMSMRDSLPFERLVQTTFMSVGFEKSQKFDILCNVFEDNAGALSLANMQLPRMKTYQK